MDFMPDGYVEKFGDKYAVRDGVGQWWAGAERRWRGKASEAMLFDTEMEALEERNRHCLGDEADLLRVEIVGVLTVYVRRWSLTELARHLEQHRKLYISGPPGKEGVLLELRPDTLRNPWDTSHAHDEPTRTTTMKTFGLPDQFWIVLKPSPVSTVEDICFACTFSRLINQVRGGLQEDEIVAIYADETEGRQAAARLLGMYPARPRTWFSSRSSSTSRHSRSTRR